MSRYHQQTGKPRREIRTQVCDVVVRQETHRPGDGVLDQQDVGCWNRIETDARSKLRGVLIESLEGADMAPFLLVKLRERWNAVNVIDQRYDLHRSPWQRSPNSLPCRFDNKLQRLQVPRQTFPTDKLRGGCRCHECVTERLTCSRCGDVDFDHR
jgi:hypothetical protein